jgi:glycine hydroxymethyltransferase
VGHAQVISTTTHKTLRGPRGAMLLCGSEHAQALDRAVFPGLQGGPRDHTIAGIAVALHEAAQPGFRDYAAQIVANAKRLAQVLAERGFDLVSGGTDNHLLLIDLTSKGSRASRPRRAWTAPGWSPTTTPSPTTRAGRSTPPASGWARPG